MATVADRAASYRPTLPRIPTPDMTDFLNLLDMVDSASPLADLFSPAFNQRVIDTLDRGASLDLLGYFSDSLTSAGAEIARLGQVVYSNENALLTLIGERDAAIARAAEEFERGAERIAELEAEQVDAEAAATAASATIVRLIGERDECHHALVDHSRSVVERDEEVEGLGAILDAVVELGRRALWDGELIDPRTLRSIVRQSPE